MKASKKNRVVREGDPLFEKLKSQMRPDISAGVAVSNFPAKGLKTITLIKTKRETD